MIPLKRVVLATLLCLVACKPEARTTAPAQPPGITVDWSSPLQTIVGFGGTMGWIHPHPDQREKVFDLLFRELGSSVLRIQALGGEGGDEESLEPENDNADASSFNWSRFPIKTTEAKNAIIIKAAQARGVKTVIAVPWSPPGWMKTTGLRAGGGSLKPELAGEFAELWAAYIIGMKREFDIGIRHVSIQNEPDLTYYYPTCRWEPELLAKAEAAVRARLKKEGLDVQVLGPDTCRIYNMPEFVEAEAAAKAEPPGAPILTHLYDLSIPYERVDRDPPRWREAREFARKHGRPLWLVETANYLSYGVPAASWEEAMVWAQRMHWALAEGNCEVVCWWALFFDKKGEALIYCAKSEDPAYEITPKFYTSMNWFRFVRPGMVRCSVRPADPDLLVTAFRDTADRCVIVIVNPADKPIATALPAGAWQRYETTAARKCERIEWQGGAAQLPAQSVTTFVRNSTGD